MIARKLIDNQAVIIMAKGKKCNKCGYHMYALHEDKVGGKWRVSYVCRNGKCNGSATVFE